MPDPRAEPPSAPEDKRLHRILLADDDATSRRLLGASLQAAGYEVSAAADGLEALAAIEASPPDLLVLDFEMPALNGAELCRRLRAAPRDAIRQLPVIMLTGHAGDAEEVACLAAGANDFVTKPVGREVFIARIETQLRLGALSRALRTQNRELARWRAEQEADLEAARTTQRVIIGSSPPAPAGWKVEALYSPLIQVGGDVYGWRQLGGERWLFWVADATGHGIAAALFTTLAAWLFHRAAAASASPADILAAVNAEFWNVFRGRSFMTACCAVVDGDGLLSFAGAGHPPLLVRRSSGAVEPLTSRGTMIGIANTMELSAVETRLTPGDLALLYTDGLFSLRTREGPRLGPHELEDELSHTTPGDDLLARLPAALQQRAGAARFEDDIAAILLRRSGTLPPAAQR